MIHIPHILATVVVIPCHYGGEEKGDICLQQKLSIKIINGRAYHPQTQGSVERANQTFKRRLGALQRERGISNSKWVELLLELAVIINTTSSLALPGKQCPYFVYFGWKLHWIDPTYRLAEPLGLNEDEDVDADVDGYQSDSDNIVLTEIESRVAEFEARQHACIIKQSQNSRVVDFTDVSIATLRIHPKLRLKTESERLAVRILVCDHRQYKLMSRHGRISSRFQGDELNEVNSNSVSILSGDIPMEPEYKAGKEVIIPLSLAVARENNQGSITSAQRARRATAASGSGSGSALANSPVRQRRWRLDPSPELSPEQQLEPIKARNRRVVKE